MSILSVSIIFFEKEAAYAMDDFKSDHKNIGRVR